MTAADSAVILVTLNGVTSLRVHDGYVVGSNEDLNTISAPLPYVVFYPRSDEDEGETLAGSVTSSLNGFQITGVGSTREQAERVLERARGVLNRRRLQFPPGKRLVRRVDGMGVRRDDVWTRPDGGPLFYAADQYTVLI